MDMLILVHRKVNDNGFREARVETPHSSRFFSECQVFFLRFEGMIYVSGWLKDAGEPTLG